MRLFNILMAALALFGLTALPAQADHVQENPGLHKIVIQVSTNDAATQTIAMNNAVNLQKALGMDNVAIEIVAYGPGLSMLINGSEQSQRVTSLAKQDITFSACGNTKAKMERKTGQQVALSEGVSLVPAGVLRIMELQEQGYSYVRP